MAQRPDRTAVTGFPDAVAAGDFLAGLRLQTRGTERAWRSSGTDAALTDVDSAAPQPASGNVLAAGVAAFTDGLSGRQKADVLNSTLLAQLSANGRHDRERESAAWYAFYRTVLLQVGWVVRPQSARIPALAGLTAGPLIGLGRVGWPGRLPDRPGRPSGLPVVPFARLAVRGVRFTADSAVLTVLQPVASDAEVRVTRATLAAVRELDDRDRRAVVFESSVHTRGRGAFHVETLSVTAEGVVRMTIATFFFVTDATVTRLLPFAFPSRTTQMFHVRETFELDAAVYATVREQVVAQLGDQASAYIFDLDIG